MTKYQRQHFGKRVGVLVYRRFLYVHPFFIVHVTGDGFAGQAKCKTVKVVLVILP